METKERLMLKYALGGIVLSTSLHSAALSLGGSSGQAIIGRPLDMSVRSSAPLADIESAGCLQAQVLYGDTVLPAGSVSLSVQGTADGAVIRVRSSVPVNEPVVSVVLNTGCAADRFSRKYTLLADLDPALAPVAAAPVVPLVALAPSAQPPAPPAPAPSAQTTTPAPVPARSPVSSLPAPVPRPTANVAPRPRPAPRPAPVATDAPVRKPAPVAEKKVVAASPAPKPAPSAPAAPAPVPAGPRLKLDPIDLSPGRNPGLKLNTELQNPPTGNEADRKAAAELWAALNTPPEKAAEDAKRFAAMEADLKALREQQAGLQASMASLTAQLQAERDERAPKSLLYALAAALVLAGAALAWLIAERRRQRVMPAAEEQPWWQSAQQADAGPSLSASEALAPVAPATVSAAPIDAPVVSAGVTDSSGIADLHVTEATESSFAQLMDDSPVSVEALLDLVQQVEFFESLQQQDDAAMVLEQFVEEHPTACELPYLLLMQQAQAQGQAERLAALGARFQQAFGAPAPDASCYTPGQAGLATQTKFMDVLTRFWPEEQVLGLLRNTLMSAPGTGLLEKHSLQAFEDALLLYSVAHTLQSDTDLRGPAAVAPAAVVPAGTDLDLDLSFAPEHDVPAPAEAPAAADATEQRRELPMLDFDLFAIDDGKGDKTPNKP